MPFNFHLHFWKPHCSESPTVISSGASCCIGMTSIQWDGTTTTKRCFVKYTMIANAKKKKKKQSSPPTTHTTTFIVKVALLSTILMLQFHSWSTLDTCLGRMEITSRHLGVSSSHSEAGVSLRIMLCLLGMETLL